MSATSPDNPGSRTTREVTPFLIRPGQRCSFHAMKPVERITEVVGVGEREAQICDACVVDYLGVLAAHLNNRPVYPPQEPGMWTFDRNFLEDIRSAEVIAVEHRRAGRFNLGAVAGYQCAFCDATPDTSVLLFPEPTQTWCICDACGCAAIPPLLAGIWASLSQARLRSHDAGPARAPIAITMIEHELHAAVCGGMAGAALIAHANDHVVATAGTLTIATAAPLAQDVLEANRACGIYLHGSTSPGIYLAGERATLRAELPAGFAALARVGKPWFVVALLGTASLERFAALCASVAELLSGAVVDALPWTN